MDKATADILAKVKKLMALGSSPSEAEAASALEKARTLLARYGLSLSDVETHSSDVTEGVLLEKKRLRSWESQLIYVITVTTFTQALHVSRGGVSQVLLIGREINTLAAAELFAYLHLVVLKLGRAHSGSVTHLESFKMGAVQRIGERLNDLSAEDSSKLGPWASKEAGSRAGREKKSGTTDARDRLTDDQPSAAAEDRQLAVQMTETATKENKSYIAKKYGKTKTKRAGRRVDAASYYRGIAAGDGVSLNRQIK